MHTKQHGPAPGQSPPTCHHTCPPGSPRPRPAYREIAKLKRGTSTEVEAFVHGALCVSYSGQCFSSEAWGGRSANRGQCAQACRMPYGLVVNGELRVRLLRRLRQGCMLCCAATGASRLCSIRTCRAGACCGV
jgi:hypothetical protein